MFYICKLMCLTSMHHTEFMKRWMVLDAWMSLSGIRMSQEIQQVQVRVEFYVDGTDTDKLVFF